MAKKDMEIEVEAMPVDNVGIMQGFLEMMNEDDDEFGEDDEYEAGEMLGRTPDSPEILMNNLRGDMRSIDARRDELADLVGYSAAAETPESVLAMLQPVLAQQGIGAMVPPGMGLPPGAAMPPQPSPVSPVGAPNVPNVPNVPNMPSDMMTPMQPMPAGGIGDMAPGAMPPGPPPLQMARGGIVQRFSQGSTPAAVTPAEDAAFYSPETVEMARKYAAAYLTPKTTQTSFDLGKETAAQQALLKNIMGGAEQDDLNKSQLLLDLASRAFGYAANVDDQGRPLRGSALSRLAGATRTLPQTMSQFIAQKSKQDQAIKLAALQAAQKKEERGLETALAQDKTRFDFAMEVLKAEAKKKNYELLSPEEARKLGLPLDRNQVYQREKGTNDISPVGSPTTIIQNIPSQKADVAYAEAIAKGGGEEDLALYNTAIKAPANIEKHNDTIKQIQKSTVTTGFGADLIKNINRAKAQILNDKRAGKEVTDTEVLNTMLGSQVFTLLPALGIGARGMDTPAEREFMVAVLTGSIALSKDTLLEMANIRRNLEVRAVEKYNNLVESGELDPFFEARNRKKKTIEIPSLVPINPVGAAGDPRNDPAVEGALGGGR
jgi:hypothetical protein